MKDEEITMVYIDIKNTKDKMNINELLRDMNLEWEEIKSKEHIGRNQLIITDNNLDRIKEYRKISKNIIVYNKSKEFLTDEVYYERGVYTYSILQELEIILKIIQENRRKQKIMMQGLGVFLLVLLGTFSITSTFRTLKNNYSKKEEPVVVKEQDDIKKENIVFFGDSITAMYELENYYDDRIPVVNSGITGNTTEDLLKDIEERVYVYNPTKVFILIGTNDISATDLSNKEIVENIKTIIEKIHKNRKKAKIYIESILPIRNTENTPTDLRHTRENSRIRAINDLIQEMCKEEDAAEYIDLFNTLVDTDGELNMKYSIEGVHMNNEGYKVITNQLKKYID